MNKVTLITPTLELSAGTATATLALENAGLRADSLVLVDADQQGYTRTVNRGLRIAHERGHDACILVDDCEPRTVDWLRELQTWAYKRQSIWFTGPSGPCRTPPQCTGEEADPREPMFVSHLAGFCLYVKHEVFEQIGYLSTRYRHYGSDVDWQWRARHAGGRSVWVPGVYVWHGVHGVRQWIDEDHAEFKRVWSC